MEWTGQVMNVSVARDDKNADTEDLDRVVLIWVWMFLIRCPHCDLGSGKTLVESESNRIGIIG